MVNSKKQRSTWGEESLRGLAAEKREEVGWPVDRPKKANYQTGVEQAHLFHFSRETRCAGINSNLQ